MLRITIGLGFFALLLAASQTQDSAAEFKSRLDEYMKLRSKVAKEITPLPKRATPQQMVAHEEGLGKRLREARKNVKQGNVFTPSVTRYMKAALHESVKDAVRRAMKDEELDLRRNTEGEAPPKVRLKVNGKYPDATPVASVPLQVLERLPRLPEGLEYRYVGSDLLLHDTQANLIIDYARNIVPTL